MYTCKRSAVSVFARFGGLFSCLALCGCVITPTVNTTTEVVTCCSAYAYYFGYTWSGNYAKQGNNWSVNGKVSWKYLQGP